MTEEVARQQPTAEASSSATDKEASAHPADTRDAPVPDVPPPPPDDQNPALIDARKAFIITLVGALLFIASVVLFIL